MSDMPSWSALRRAHARGASPKERTATSQSTSPRRREGADKPLSSTSPRPTTSTFDSSDKRYISAREVRQHLGRSLRSPILAQPAPLTLTAGSSLTPTRPTQAASARVRSALHYPQLTNPSLRIDFASPAHATNEVRAKVEFIQSECEEVRRNVRQRQLQLAEGIAAVKSSMGRLGDESDLAEVDALLLDAHKAQREFAQEGQNTDNDDVELLALEENNRDTRRIDRPLRAELDTTKPPFALQQRHGSNERLSTNEPNQIVIDPSGERKIKQLLELSRLQGREIEHLREEAQEAKRLLSTKDSKLSESEALVHHQRLKITSLNGTLRGAAAGGEGGGGGGSFSPRSGGMPPSSPASGGSGTPRLPSLLANAQYLSQLKQKNISTPFVAPQPYDAAPVDPPQSVAAASLASITPICVPTKAPGWFSSFSAAFHNQVIPGDNEDEQENGNASASDDGIDNDSRSDGGEDGPAKTDHQQVGEDSGLFGNNNSMAFTPKSGGGGLRNVSFSTAPLVVGEADLAGGVRGRSPRPNAPSQWAGHRQYSHAELLQALFSDSVAKRTRAAENPLHNSSDTKAVLRLFNYWRPQEVKVPMHPSLTTSHLQQSKSPATLSANTSRRASRAPRLSTSQASTGGGIPKGTIVDFGAINSASSFQHIKNASPTWTVHAAPRLCFLVSGGLPFGMRIRELLPPTEVNTLWGLISKCLRTAAYLTEKNLKLRYKLLVGGIKGRKGGGGPKPRADSSVSNLSRMRKPSSNSLKGAGGGTLPSWSVEDSSLFCDSDDSSEAHASVEAAALMCCGGGIFATLDEDSLSFTIIHSTLDGASEFCRIFKTLLAVVSDMHQQATESMMISQPGAFNDMKSLAVHLAELENAGRGSRDIPQGFVSALSLLSNVAVRDYAVNSPQMSSTGQSPLDHPHAPSTEEWLLYRAPQSANLGGRRRRASSVGKGNTNKKAAASLTKTPSFVKIGDAPVDIKSLSFPFRKSCSDSRLNNGTIDLKVTCVVAIAIKDGCDVEDISNYLASIDGDQEAEQQQQICPLMNPRFHCAAVFPQILSGAPVVAGAAQTLCAAVLDSIERSYISQSRTVGYEGAYSVEGTRYSTLLGATIVEPLVLHWSRTLEAHRDDEVVWAQQNGNNSNPDAVRKKVANAKPKGLALISFQLSRVSDAHATVHGPSRLQPSAPASSRGRLLEDGDPDPSANLASSNALGRKAVANPPADEILPPSGVWKVPLLLATSSAPQLWQETLSRHQQSGNSASPSPFGIMSNNSRPMSTVTSPAAAFLTTQQTGAFASESDASSDIVGTSAQSAECEIQLPQHNLCNSTELFDWVRRFQGKSTPTITVAPPLRSAGPARLLSILGICHDDSGNSHDGGDHSSASSLKIAPPVSYSSPQSIFGVVTIAMDLPSRMKNLHVTDSAIRSTVDIIETHIERLGGTYFGKRVSSLCVGTRKGNGEEDSDSLASGSFIIIERNTSEGQWVLLVRGGCVANDVPIIRHDGIYPSPSRGSATLASRLLRFSALLQEALLKFSYWPLDLMAKDHSCAEKRVLVGDGSTTRLLYRGPRVKVGVDVVTSRTPCSVNEAPSWLSWDYRTNKPVLHSVLSSGSVTAGLSYLSPPPNSSPTSQFSAYSFSGGLQQQQRPTSAAAGASQAGGVGKAGVRSLPPSVVDALPPSLRAAAAAANLIPPSAGRGILSSSMSLIVPESPLLTSIKLCCLAKGGQVLVSHTVAIQAALEAERACPSEPTCTPSANVHSLLPQVEAATVSLQPLLEGILLGPCGMALISSAVQVGSSIKEDIARLMRRVLIQRDHSNNTATTGASSGSQRNSSATTAATGKGQMGESASSGSTMLGAPFASSTSHGSHPSLASVAVAALALTEVPKVALAILKEVTSLLTLNGDSNAADPDGPFLGCSMFEAFEDEAAFAGDLNVGVFSAQMAPLALRSAEEIEFGEYQSVYADLLHAGVIVDSTFKYPFVSAAALEEEMKVRSSRSHQNKRTTSMYGNTITSASASPGMSEVSLDNLHAERVDFADRSLAIEAVVGRIPTPEGFPLAASQASVLERLTGHCWSTARDGVQEADLRGGKGANSTAPAITKGSATTSNNSRDGILTRRAESLEQGCFGKVGPFTGVAVFTFVDQRSSSTAVTQSGALAAAAAPTESSPKANRIISQASSSSFSTPQATSHSPLESQTAVYFTKTSRFVLESVCPALGLFGGFFVSVDGGGGASVPVGRVWDAAVALFPTPNHAVQCSLYLTELARLATSREAEELTGGNTAGNSVQKTPSPLHIAAPPKAISPVTPNHVYQIRGTVHVLMSPLRDVAPVCEHLLYQRFKVTQPLSPSFPTSSGAAVTAWSIIGPEVARVISVASSAGADGWTVVTDEAKCVIDHFDRRVGQVASWAHGASPRLRVEEKGASAIGSQIDIQLPSSHFALTGAASTEIQIGLAPAAKFQSQSSGGPDYVWSPFAGCKCTGIAVVELPTTTGADKPPQPTTLTEASLLAFKAPSTPSSPAATNLGSTYGNPGVSAPWPVTAAAFAIVPSMGKTTLWAVGSSRVGLASSIGIQLTPNATPTSAAALSRALIFQIRATNMMRLIPDDIIGGRGSAGGVSNSSFASPTASPGLRGGALQVVASSSPAMSPAASPALRGLKSPTGDPWAAATRAASPSLKRGAGGGPSGEQQQAKPSHQQLTAIVALRNMPLRYEDLFAALPKEIANPVPISAQLLALEAARHQYSQWKNVADKGGALPAMSPSSPPSACFSVARRSMSGWPLPTPDTTFVFVSPEGVNYLRSQVLLHVSTESLQIIVNAVKMLLDRGYVALGGGKGGASQAYRSFGRLLYLDSETGSVLCVFESPVPACAFACQLQELLNVGSLPGAEAITTSCSWPNDLLISPAWTPVSIRNAHDSLHELVSHSDDEEGVPPSAALAQSPTLRMGEGEAPHQSTAPKSSPPKQHHSPTPAFRGLRVRIGIASGMSLATIDSQHRHYESFRRMPLQYASSPNSPKGDSTREYSNVSLVYVGEPIITAMLLAGVAVGGETLATQSVLQRVLRYYTNSTSSSLSAPDAQPVVQSPSSVRRQSTVSLSALSTASGAFNKSRSTNVPVVPFGYSLVDVSRDVTLLRSSGYDSSSKPRNSVPGTGGLPDPSSSNPRTVLNYSSIGISAEARVASLLPPRLEERREYFRKVRQNREELGRHVYRRIYELEPVSVDGFAKKGTHLTEEPDSPHSNSGMSRQALFYQYPCLCTSHEIAFTLASSFLLDFMSIWQRTSYCLQEGLCFALLERIRRTAPHNSDTTYLQHRCAKVVDPRGAPQTRIGVTRRMAFMSIVRPPAEHPPTRMVASLHRAAVLSHELHLPIASQFGQVLQLVTTPTNADQRRFDLSNNALTSMLREATGGTFANDEDDAYDDGISRRDDGDGLKEDTVSTTTPARKMGSEALLQSESRSNGDASLAAPVLFGSGPHSAVLQANHFFDFSHGVAVVAVFLSKEVVAHVNRFGRSAANNRDATVSAGARRRSTAFGAQPHSLSTGAAFVYCEAETPLTAVMGDTSSFVTSAESAAPPLIALLLEAASLFAGRIAHVEGDELGDLVESDIRGGGGRGAFTNARLEDNITAVVVFHTANVAVRFATYLMSAVYCSDVPSPANTTKSSTMTLGGGGRASVAGLSTPSSARAGTSPSSGSHESPTLLPLRAYCCAAVHFGTEVEPSQRSGATIIEVTASLERLLRLRGAEEAICGGVVALTEEAIRALPPTAFDSSCVDVRSVPTGGGGSVPFSSGATISGNPASPERRGSVFSSAGGQGLNERILMFWKPSYSPLSCYRFVGRDTFVLESSNRQITLRLSLPTWLELSPMWRAAQRSHPQHSSAGQPAGGISPQRTPSSSSFGGDLGGQLTDDGKMSIFLAPRLSQIQQHSAGLSTRVAAREQLRFAASDRVERLLARRLLTLQNRIEKVGARAASRHHARGRTRSIALDSDSSDHEDSSVSSEEGRCLADSDDEDMNVMAGAIGSKEAEQSGVAIPTKLGGRASKGWHQAEQRPYGAIPPPLPTSFDETSYRMQRLIKKAARSADAITSPDRTSRHSGVGSLSASLSVKHGSPQPQPLGASLVVAQGQMETLLTDLTTQHYRSMEVMREEREAEVVALKTRIAELETHMLAMNASTQKDNKKRP